MRLKISARKSDLARLQAYQVGEALKKSNPAIEIQYNFRESLGDKNLNDPLWRMPEKGVFTEDFVQDLLDEKTDMVVHSWKDLPTAPRQGTEIVATLPRADQRDLLLFKKKQEAAVRSSKTIQIFSSSPRRAYNLENFLKEHLPLSLEKVEFCNVRGNIQTRLRKLMEDDKVSALIVAKAAIDRLLSVTEPEFAETQSYLRQCLQELNYVVLPLTVNPNAAAQGALAIEIKEGKKDLLALLQKINCAETFRCAQEERDVLASFGGGCHQKIGVAVLERPYGQIFSLRGLTDAGQVLKERSLKNKVTVQKLPANQLASSKELEALRVDLSVQIPQGIQALWVAKAEAMPKGFSFQGLLWTAGLQTWKKLAERGYWVHGSAEGLGEEEDPQLTTLQGDAIHWTKLSHKDAPLQKGMDSIATYEVHVSAENWDSRGREAFYWHSGSQFLAALSKEPGLRNKRHACGPGNTYKTLKTHLGENAVIEIYLDEEEWRKTCSL